MRFARRTNWELTPNKISGILEDFKTKGQKVLDLTESNPTRCGITYPQAELLSALSQEENMLYTPATKGLLTARKAVVAYYGQKNIKLSEEQIFLTASTSEAYSFLFRLLADPGDHILFPAPSYPLFDFLIDLNDLECGFYPLKYANRWMVDLQGIAQNMMSNTKALVTVNPNNPTGSYIKKAELAELNNVCKACSCALISDEVFFDYTLENNPDVVSLAGNTENLTFTMGGLSKTLGLPQMKLSWIVVNGPQKLMEDAMNRLEVITDTYLSVNTPVQNAFLKWMMLRPVIQKSIMDRIKINRDHFLKVWAGQSLRAEGGWYMIAKLNEGLDEEQLVEEFLIRDQVYTHPGYFFNFNEEPYLIFSLLARPEDFLEGLKRISVRLKERI